jgi:hypothetical protein
MRIKRWSVQQVRNWFRTGCGALGIFTKRRSGQEDAIQVTNDLVLSMPAILA